MFGSRFNSGPAGPSRDGDFHPAWRLLFFFTLAATIAFYLSHPLRDYDLWWQMAMGRYMVEHRTLYVDHTVFNWTPVQISTVYCAWIGQILLYAAHSLAGEAGLWALRYAVFILVALFGIAAARRYGVLRHPLVWLALALCVLMSTPAQLVRPQMFTFLNFGAAVLAWHLVRTAKEEGWKYCYLFPAITLVAANTHGAFIFLAPFYALVLVGDLVNAWLFPAQALAPRVRKHLFLALALCGVAVFATPYGWDYVRHLLWRAGEGDADLRLIAEFRWTEELNPPPYYTLDYFIAASAALLLGLSACLRRSRFDVTLILLNVFFGGLYLRYIRTTFFWGPVLAMSVAQMLACRPSWLWPRWAVWRGVMATALLLVTLVGAARGISAFACEEGFGLGFRLNDYFPVAEARYVDEHYAGTRFGNMYQDGGYLMWTLWPRTRLMIDGRFFPFKDWYLKYGRFSFGGEVEAFLAEFRPEIVLVNHMQTNLEYWFFNSDDWKPAFFGRSGALFVARNATLPAGRVEYAPDLEDFRNILHAEWALLAAGYGGFWDAALAIRKGLEHSRCELCYNHKRTFYTIDKHLEGLRLYAQGQYDQAVPLLFLARQGARPRRIIGSCFFHLALKTWEGEDDANAVALARLARLFLHPRISYIYNQAVLDWYAERNNLAVETPPYGLDEAKKAGDWKTDLATVLKYAAIVPEENRFAVDTAQGILDGTFTGRPRLLPYPDPLPPPWPEDEPRAAGAALDQAQPARDPSSPRP